MVEVFPEKIRKINSCALRRIKTTPCRNLPRVSIPKNTNQRTINLFLNNSSLPINNSTLLFKRVKKSFKRKIKNSTITFDNNTSAFYKNRMIPLHQNIIAIIIKKHITLRFYHNIIFQIFRMFPRPMILLKTILQRQKFLSYFLFHSFNPFNFPNFKTSTPSTTKTPKSPTDFFERKGEIFLSCSTSEPSRSGFIDGRTTRFFFFHFPTRKHLNNSFLTP